MTVLLVLLAVIFLGFAALGGLSVWTRDEHAPTWIPPEPEYVRRLPPVYDQDADPRDT